jgi:hypothetical protein
MSPSAAYYWPAPKVDPTLRQAQDTTYATATRCCRTRASSATWWTGKRSPI